MKDILKKQSTHDDVLELLPWFVNDTLEGKELLKVMTHLSECADCQKERDRLQLLQTLVKQDDTSIAPDYKPSFEKLMDRIDAEEQPNNVMPLRRGRHLTWMKYAAAASLVVGIASVIAVSRPQPAETLNVSNSPVNTASEPGANILNNSKIQRLSLTFEADLDSSTLRTAFVTTGAYIVSGPDENGQYVVEIVSDSGEEELIHSMTQVDGVKYAALLD